MRRLLWGLVLIHLVLAHGAQSSAAEEPSVDPQRTESKQASSPDRVFDLGIVEAIDVEQGVDRSPATETVDDEEAQAWHRDDLAEMLDLLPGVYVQNVGQRRERLVSLRGFTSRQVPLFIDGIPVYVPYDGNVDFSRFGIAYASEAVVSKGLASVLYGPNILGGAINIVSRRPSTPLEGSVSLAFETDDEAAAPETRTVASIGAIGGLGAGEWYVHATASHADADDFFLPSDFVPTSVEDGEVRENADSRDSLLSAKIGFLPQNGDEYALTYYRQDARKNSPLYAGSAPGVQVRFWQWPDWDKESVYFSARNELAPKATLRWRLFHDSFYNVLNSYDDATYSSFDAPYAFQGSVYDDYTIGANTDFEWRWNERQSTRAALHWKRDLHREVDEIASPEERYEDRSYAAALEHEWKASRELTFVGGYAHTVQDGRSAENAIGEQLEPFATDSADAANVLARASWQATRRDSLLAGISRKTRFPTMKDRFSFRLGSAIPNPGLEPETALHYEVAWRHQSSRWSLQAALFQADVEDAIENVTIDPALCSAPNPTCFQQRNIGEQRNTGAELSLGWAPGGGWSVAAQASLLDRDNSTSPEVRPIDTPEQKYRLALAYQPAPEWTLRAEGLHESERASTTDGMRMTDAFTIVNAFARHQVLPQLGIELGGRNLGDELYAYQEGFFEPGRTWLLQLDFDY